MSITKEELDRRFDFHKLSVDEAKLLVETMEEIRKQAKLLALRITQWTPESREQSLAITHLEEVVVWANKAISGN